MFFHNQAIRKRSILFFILLCMTNFYSCIYFDLKIYQHIHLVILLFFIHTTLKCYFSAELLHKKYILAMVLLPLGSIISAQILHNQSCTDTLVVHRMHLGWLIYFLMAKFKYTSKDIFKALFVFSVIYSIINLTQQWTFPLAPFGVRTIGSHFSSNLLDGEIEKRFGMLRFGIEGSEFVVLTLFLLIRNRRKNQLLYTILLLSAIMGFGSRVSFFSSVLGLCLIGFSYTQTKLKFIYIGAITILIVVIVLFWTNIFGDLGNVQDNFEDSRLTSYTYFWKEYISHPLSILMGNGVPHGSSKYALEGVVTYVGTEKAILSDVGILRTMYFWGGIYTFVFLLLMTKLLFNRYLKIELKAIIIVLFINIWVYCPLWEIGNMIYMGLFIYLCDISIKEKKQLVSQNQTYFHQMETEKNGDNA